ncbi:ThiF family adenylyltransferase [Galbibacter sp.]|jgi:adenylyltransferase/sulfurtransferase|uniref:ThiF family adenylyltransferase n=1 Tax=Galbibacter sp. TaxID=2918471 RepID=UPI003A94C2CB
MSANRYIRQTTLKGFGAAGQARLQSSSVLIVGAGGLGVPVLQYLNAMGVGTIGIVENDKIELSNLQRQPIYSEQDIGKPKIKVAIEKLQAQNPTTIFHCHAEFLSTQNALEILKPYDVIVDATDNFPTRYLINDACVILNKPFVYGALHAFEGQVSVFNYQLGPTYRCLFPQMPGKNEMPDCNVNGVLGIIPGIIGNFQALEVIKILTGIAEPLSGKLLLYDGLTQKIQQVSFKTNPENKLRTQLEERYEHISCDLSASVGVEEFEKMLHNPKQFQLVDVRSPEEFSDFHLEDSINIPLQELPNRTDEVDLNREVVLICQSGIRSEKALNYLNQQFECTIYQLEGGLQNYTHYGDNH